MKKLIQNLGIFMLGSIISLGMVYAQDSVKKFPDVDYNAYYANAVNAMVARGVIKGYDNGNFGPNDYVTRAQLATVLDRNEMLSDNYSRIMDLRELICGSLDKSKLSTNVETWGNVQATYEKVCETQGWYL